MKALYCIGAGELGRPVFRWAKGAGFFVAASDRNPNVLEDENRDELFRCDALDLNAHIRNIERLQRDGHEIVGVISMTDEKATVTVSSIQARLGLQGHAVEHVAKCLDKRFQARRLAECSLPVPETKQINRPMIIKPVDGCGSVGTHIIDTPHILQDLIVGRHIDLNGLWIDGAYYELGHAERWMTDPPHTFPICGIDPSDLSGDEVRAGHNLLKLASAALGITGGPVKADMMLNADGWHIIEITPRFHGDIWSVWTSVLGSGVNPWGTYLGWLMTGEVTVDAGTEGNWSLWRIAGSTHRQEVTDTAKMEMCWWKGGPLVDPSDNRDISGYEVWSGPLGRHDDGVSAEILFRQPEIDGPRKDTVAELS